MKRLHRMILRMLPGPIAGWLGTLMFLLLMQFLIKYLPEIAGKGLPYGVIAELVAYNLAYMVVLAVPMSILIGTLMVFGKISESRAYVVIKSAGVSPLQLIWPTLLVGILLTGAMMYFNNVVLPEANFRARNLWQDIRRKQPGFELKPGVFYEGVDQYSILVQHIPRGTNELEDVLIYDYTEGPRNQTIIKARRGELRTIDDGLRAEIVLEDGEVHRLLPPPSVDAEERYERLAFGRHRMRLDLADFLFERSDPKQGYRSDRTMRTADMIRLVDSLDASVAAARERLFVLSMELGTDAARSSDDFGDMPSPAVPGSTDAPPRPAQTFLTGSELEQTVFARAMTNARSNRSKVDDARRTMSWEHRRADRYRVEIHKKHSIALACFIFALIGAPLGLSVRRGGLGTVGALATGIFLFYWVTLVQGEKLADRGFLEPWIGMWAANIAMLALGLWLMVYITMDLRATPPLRRRLRGRASDVWSRVLRRPADGSA